MKVCRAILVGGGNFVRGVHIPAMARHAGTRIVGLVEPSPASNRATLEKIQAAGDAPPPAFASLESLIEAGVCADVALVATPHKFHREHILACLDYGLDVFVEKPMVITADEAEAVIRHRDRTGRLVVVGFPGSLSPAMARAREIIEDGTIGKLAGVSGVVHQNWHELAAGTWRMDPEISGGGFLFDTGSHIVNNIVDLVRSPIADIHAILQKHGTAVDLEAALSGRFENGVSFTLNLLGNTFGCDGHAQFIGSKRILQLGMWGDTLKISGERIRDPFETIHVGTHHDTWKHFVQVWKGELPNPSPPEVGLRFARFMDLVKAHATVLD